MNRANERAARLQRWAKWYGPARFGLFFHWGQRTGGGSSAGHAGQLRPYRYPTIADFEAAAGEPADVARNLVDIAVRVGARYIIQTVFHSCDRYAVMYPTSLQGFRVKTTRHYIGAILDEAHRRDIKVMLYVPEAGEEMHIRTPGGPWVDEKFIGDDAFKPLLFGLIRELIQNHPDRIAGFWLDGYYRSVGREFPAFVHSLLPNAIVTHNNDTSFWNIGLDVSTTEGITSQPDPPYNRPSALLRPHEWGVLPPKRDFNEDIPTCNDWFHSDTPEDAARLAESPYVKDKTFWVREMVSSLGQRGRWNYALGLGPTINGQAPANFEPMIENMARFMHFARESIYNTTGGEGSLFYPGWWSNGAFGSVTRSLDDPRVHYLHLTTPPKGPQLKIQTDADEILSVTHLRTGQPIRFEHRGSLDFHDGDWSDTNTYGNTVLKVLAH